MAGPVTASEARVRRTDAVPVTDLPSGDDWTFEIKFDGYRCLAVKNGAKTRSFRATESG